MYIRVAGEGRASPRTAAPLVDVSIRRLRATDRHAVGSVTSERTTMRAGLPIPPLAVADWGDVVISSAETRNAAARPRATSRKVPRDPASRVSSATRPTTAHNVSDEDDPETVASLP